MFNVFNNDVDHVFDALGILLTSITESIECFPNTFSYAILNNVCLFSILLLIGPLCNICFVI